MLKRSLHYSHELLKEVINPGDTVVDATMGNGNDTLFLAELVGEDGYVHAFDVQEQALENTSKKIKEHHCEKQTKLHLTGHENKSVLLFLI
jgi:ubiquinone/menaquinone biosynthesis C-methylase UbiE